MKDTYNWGIIGPGKISKKFAKAISLSPRARLAGVASRTKSRAEAFGLEFGANKVYGDYESLARDPDIDVIYIGTPHAFHCENTLTCLRHGTPVLCEKAFALNTGQVDQMVSLAREKDTFLMEAIWTRFHPNLLKVLELAESGRIGDVKGVRADFGFHRDFDPTSRLYDPALGGGSLLDIGIYPLFFAHTVLGTPDEIKAVGTLSPTGSDESCMAVLKYNNGQLASITSSVMFESQVEAEVFGTKGRIKVHHKWHEPGNISIWKGWEKVEEIAFPEELGYVYEIEEVAQCLDKGLKESPRLPLSFSRSLMQSMDEIRRQLGVVYPGE